MVTESVATPRPGLVRRVAVVIGLLVAIVLVFATIRVVVDWPHILAGTTGDDFSSGTLLIRGWRTFTSRRGSSISSEHRCSCRGGSAPGTTPCTGASGGCCSPAHWSPGFSRSSSVSPYAWGGAPEAAAAVVFGCWFVVCLVLAFRTIRRHDVRHHRRWMVRAFAVGTGVGTIRIWVGIFEGIEQGLSGGTTPATPDPTMFGVAFWLAFTMHVALGEWWLRRTPALTG